jgi:hypothetical protein
MVHFLDSTCTARYITLKTDSSDGKMRRLRVILRKVMSLTLQGYIQGQTRLNHPWLDPETASLYENAITLPVSLQATAPHGLLTAPSNQMLKQGLFQQTLFALDQNSQHAWNVLIPGPASLDAPVLVPSHLLLPIFMYHHISSLSTHDPLDYSLTATTADLNVQLDWLKHQGYHSITMTELFDAFYDGKAVLATSLIRALW